MNISTIEQEVRDIFAFEIATELLREESPEISDNDIQKYLDMAKGNPWDVALVYHICQNL